MKKIYIEPELKMLTLDIDTLMAGSFEVADQPGDEKFDDEDQIEANSVSIWDMD